VTKLWQLSDGSCYHTLDGCDYQVVSANFSPDGEKVVTAPLDETAKVWCAKASASILV
jgi:WD40 repeat protein